jgi:hypothetical protein
MLQGDGLPTEADRSQKNSLSAFMIAKGQDTEGGRPKLEANKSDDESLFGRFIQSRRDKVVADFQERENAKLRRNPPKPRRSRSPKSGGKRSPVSVRSKSPDNSSARSPKSGGKRSPVSVRSKSPDNSSARSPKSGGKRSPVSVRSKSPDNSSARSPKSGGKRSPVSVRSRSARSPKSGGKRSPVSVRSKSPDSSSAGNTSLPSLKSSPKPSARSPGPLSPRINSKSPKAPAKFPREWGRKKDEQSDDSVVRETMAGNRGGEQWHILVDTPAGHAPEKLVIVPGVEFLDEEEDEMIRNEYSDEGPALEEDDDIDDDPYLFGDTRTENLNDDFSECQARSYRTKALPADPIEGVTSLRQPKGVSLQDRFDPSFKNNDMWTTDDDAPPEQRIIRRFLSGDDVSLLSVPVSVLPDDSHTGRDLSCYAFSSDAGEDMSEHDEINEDNNHDQPSVDTKTPATARRSGGRRQEQVDIMSELQQDFAINIAEDADIDDDCDFESFKEKHPASVPEDESFDSRGKSKRKKKSNQDSMQRQNSTGAKMISPMKSSVSDRSSKRLSEKTGSRMMTERIGIRAGGNRRLPDLIPQTPVRDARSYVGRSPVTTTSTPQSRSRVSSAHQQQALQQRSPRRPMNKPLRLHVGQDYTSSAGDDDEHTLGASTMSTNFTTTQRTRGDNTLSTRSLFQSERMSITESPQIPQRRKASSDEESYDRRPPSKAENDFSLQMPQRRKADFEEMSYQSALSSNSNLNANFDLLQEGASGGSIYRNAPLRKPSGDIEVLRPSKEDDLLQRAEERASTDDKSDASSTNDGVESPSYSKRFLQLNPAASGLAVGAKVTAVLESPLQIRGKKPVVDNSKLTCLNNTLSCEAPNKKGGDGDANMPKLSDWNEASKESPNTRRRRKPKLGLFKRVKSWKGSVALSEEED